MFRSISKRRYLVPALAAALALVGSAAPFRAAPIRADENLPIYTSPIDITGAKIQLTVTAPHRDTGTPVNVTLPPGTLPPTFDALLSTPLSSQIDQYWNVSKDPKTGRTPREDACYGEKGIKRQIDDAITGAKIDGVSMYNFTCDLAPKGTLLLKQVGSTLYLAYQLTNNRVSFRVTTPGTCQPDHGTPLCPNDPGASVTFAAQLVTVLRTPGLCQLSAEGGEVYTQAVQVEGLGIAALAQTLDALLFGNEHVAAAETAIQNTQLKQPLPLDTAFTDLRNSEFCNGRGSQGSFARSAFRDFATEIDRRGNIVFRVSHPAITVPTLDAPNPGGPATPSDTPPVPGFTRPVLSATQPLVAAGASVQVSGTYFPPNLNLSTALPLTIGHGGYGPGSVILGGPCFGGATELEWSPAGSRPKVQKLPATGSGACASTYTMTGLAPATTYVLRVRDCDAVTCSPWSAPLRLTTAGANGNQGNVSITLDNGISLGAAVVNSEGTFTATVTIPAGTAAGTHTLHAVSGTARADTALQVVATAAGGVKPSIFVVALLYSQTGCPNNPIASTATDSTARLFGTGFAPGAVTIYLDTAAGPTLGTLTAGADGSFCGDIKTPASNKAGAHTLVAVQNGSVLTQSAITFVVPSVIR